MSFSTTENGSKPKKRRKKLPLWWKAFLIKAWFGGAVYFFVGWGLFINTSDQLDITVALGLVLGAVTDFLINRLLVYLDNGGDAYRPYMLFYSKKFYFFFLNILYGLLLSFLIAYTYHGVNLAAVVLGSVPQGKIALGAEPVLYGILFALYDALCVALKKRIMGRHAEKKENA